MKVHNYLTQRLSDCKLGKVHYRERMKGRVFHLRDKLFHNENFVTALKSSELGESANKERCVQLLPDPDPPLKLQKLSHANICHTAPR